MQQQVPATFDLPDLLPEAWLRARPPVEEEEDDLVRLVDAACPRMVLRLPAVMEYTLGNALVRRRRAISEANDDPLELWGVQGLLQEFAGTDDAGDGLQHVDDWPLARRLREALFVAYTLETGLGGADVEALLARLDVCADAGARAETHAAFFGAAPTQPIAALLAAL